jgi:hypothetical protein
MDALQVPRFPANPIDGDRIADISGNIYQYNESQNAWIRLGILQTPPTVTLTNNGLVPPTIYNKIKQIEGLLNQGIQFDRNKIWIGNRTDNPYFYFFNSTDDLIRFKPEKLANGQQRLRIELDRGRLLQKLTRVPCIGPRGLQGPTGDAGTDGTPAANEEEQVPENITADSLEINAKVPTPINEPISLRIYKEGTQVLEAIIPITEETNGIEYNNTEEYEADPEKTDLTYDQADSTVTGTLHLQKGTFTETYNVWKYKIRQRGPRGDAGRDGKSILEIIPIIEPDTLLFTDNIFLSLRKSPSNNNLFYIPAPLPTTLCTNRLKFVASNLPTPLFAEQYIMAVEQTTASCKTIGHYKFKVGDDDSPESTDYEVPRLQLPQWSPMLRCADRKRFEISKFRWWDDLDLSSSPQPDCFQAEVPFHLLSGDRPPPDLCCVDENTLINTENGLKHIKEISIGDKVLGPDGSYKPISKVFDNGLKKCVRLKFSDGSYIDVTDDHRFPIGGSIVVAADMERGDIVHKAFGNLLHFKQHHRGNEEDYKRGFIIGYVLGDGLVKLR